MIFKDRELKVGDKLYDSRPDRGLGLVHKIDENMIFPIYIQFEDIGDTYTAIGQSASDGPCYLIWPKKHQYLCRAGKRFFITDHYFESKKQAKEIMINCEVLREIPESAEDL